jgi:RND family efflux transporter MFP subunit
MTFHLLPRRPRNRRILITLFLAVVIILAILSFTSTQSTAVAATEVKEGPFSISIKTSGEIRAANSTTLTVPRGRYNQIQVVYLVPEGTNVKAGDVVVRFSTSEVDKTISDKEQELTLLLSDQKKTKADQIARMSDLKDNLRNAELAYEQAKLQIEKMKFEAEMSRKEAEINLEKSKLSLEQAKRRIKSQVDVDKSEDLKNQMKISQIKSDVETAKADREKLTLKAPMPGLVVYEMNWTTGRKIAVGDQPWSGMSIVSLPDLSKMQAVTNVNEVDISKVKKGQRCVVRLDAFPDKPFAADIVSVGTIGQQRDRSSSLKTFEVIMDIDKSDPILKPGMTTNNEIIMETIQKALYIPIESVFEKGGKTIAYTVNGSSPEPVEIQLGPKNSNFVVVKTGLKVGDQVTLRDPTVDSKKTSQEQTPKGTSL